MAGGFNVGGGYRPPAVNAPKGPPGLPKGTPGPPPRYLNKNSGKMETTQQMKGYRAPAARQQAAARIATPKGNTTVGAGGHGAMEAPAKSWLDMNPAETNAYAARQVQQNTQNELAPLRQRAGEIYGTEQAVQGRYASMGQATDQQLQGLQGQAAEGAKTYNNQVADIVLKANQSVDTTGQNAQAQNAGYLDPQLRAAIQNQRGEVAATGLAQQGAAAALGQGEQNFTANLRAAATQRVAEGKGNISSVYAKQQAGVQGEQARLLGRQAGATTKLQTELAQKQFTNRATEAGLGLKQGDLRVKEAGVQGQERGRSITEGHYKETARQAQEKLGLERGKQGFDEWAKREDLNIKKLSAQDKARYNEASVRYKRFQESHGGKAPSPTEGRKYMSELASAEAFARQALGNQRAGGKTEKHAREEAIRKQLVEKKASGDVASAAMNLAVYGRLGPADQATALSYGMTPDMRPGWFRKG